MKIVTIPSFQPVSSGDTPVTRGKISDPAVIQVLNTYGLPLVMFGAAIPNSSHACQLSNLSQPVTEHPHL